MVKAGSTAARSSALTGPAPLYTSLLQSTAQAVAALPGDQLRGLLLQTLLSPALERHQQGAGARLWTILLGLTTQQVAAAEDSLTAGHHGHSALPLPVRIFTELVHLLASGLPADADHVQPDELGPSVLTLLYVLVMDASSRQGPEGVSVLLQMVAQLQALLPSSTQTPQAGQPTETQVLDHHLLQWLPWLLPLISLVQAAVHYTLAQPSGRHTNSSSPGTPMAGTHGMCQDWSVSCQQWWLYASVHVGGHIQARLHQAIVFLLLMLLQVPTAVIAVLSRLLRPALSKRQHMPPVCSRRRTVPQLRITMMVSMICRRMRMTRMRRRRTMKMRKRKGMTQARYGSDSQLRPCTDM
jgi:hypothetical protein